MATRTSEFSTATAALPEPAASFEMLDMTVEAPMASFTRTIQAGSAMPPPAPGPLIHRLLQNVEPPKELDRVYDRDYLALRYRAFMGGKEGSDPWKGATVLEKQLIGCVDEDGALRRDRVIQFLGHITECSRNWSLPLAILERSQKEDEEDFKRAEAGDEKEAGQTSSKTTKKSKDRQGKRKRDEDEDSDYSVKEDEDEEWQSRGESVDMDSSSSSHRSSFETKTVPAMSLQVVKVKKPPVKTPRMELFVQLGGLRVLTAWLAESKLPVLGTKTGSLMLPLLALISKLPFNREAIAKSKINKAILSTKREIKKLKASADKPADADVTSIRNPIDEIFDVINNIKRLWQEKEKFALGQPPAMANPPSDFKDKVMRHIAKMKEYRAKSLQLAGNEAKRKRVLSVKEQAKTHQQDEWSQRSHATNLRRDIEILCRERMQKEEAIRNMNLAQPPAPPPPPQRIGAQSVRSVRWKDGRRTTSPDESLLVTIRVFNKNQTASGEDVPDEVHEVSGDNDKGGKPKYYR